MTPSERYTRLLWNSAKSDNSNRLESAQYFHIESREKVNGGMESLWILILLIQINIFFFLRSVKYFEIGNMKTECKILRTHSTLLCLLFITLGILKFFIVGYLQVRSLLDFQKYEAVGLIYITGQHMEFGKPTEKVPNWSSVINTGVR